MQPLLTYVLPHAGNGSKLSICLSVSTSDSLSPTQNLTTVRNSMSSVDVI